MKSALPARLGAALLFASCAASAGPGVWTTTGPFGGSAIYLQQNQTSAAIVYAAGRGGVFRSFDSGESWARIAPGFGFITGLASGSANTLWVATSAGVFRSTDAGTSFGARCRNRPSA